MRWRGRQQLEHVWLQAIGEGTRQQMTLATDGGGVRGNLSRFQIGAKKQKKNSNTLRNK